MNPCIATVTAFFTHPGGEITTPRGSYRFVTAIIRQ